jgi:hypothetical protein
MANSRELGSIHRDWRPQLSSQTLFQFEKDLDEAPADPAQEFRLYWLWQAVGASVIAALVEEPESVIERNPIGEWPTLDTYLQLWG